MVPAIRTAVGSGSVIALSGGVGGAKLALGLSRLGLGEDLLVVANVGDDFEKFAEIRLSCNDGVNFAKLGGGGWRVKTMVVFIADPGPPDPSD